MAVEASKEVPGLVRGHSEREEQWAEAFIVVSAGRNR